MMSLQVLLRFYHSWGRDVSSIRAIVAAVVLQSTFRGDISTIHFGFNTARTRLRSITFGFSSSTFCTGTWHFESLPSKGIIGRRNVELRNHESGEKKEEREKERRGKRKNCAAIENKKACSCKASYTEN